MNYSITVISYDALQRKSNPIKRPVFQFSVKSWKTISEILAKWNWKSTLSGFKGFKSRNRKEEDWFQVQNQGNTNPKYYSWQHKYWVFPGSIFYGLGYFITNLNFFSANSRPMHSSTALWCIFSRGIQLNFTSNPRNLRTWMFVHISVPEITCIVQNLKSMYTSGYLVCSFSAMPCQIASRVLSSDVSQKIGEPMKIRSC